MLSEPGQKIAQTQKSAVGQELCSLAEGASLGKAKQPRRNSERRAIGCWAERVLLWDAVGSSAPRGSWRPIRGVCKRPTKSPLRHPPAPKPEHSVENTVLNTQC